MMDNTLPTLPSTSITTSNKKNDKKVFLFGVGVSSTQKGQLLNTILRTLTSPTPQPVVTIVTPNPEQVLLAQTDDTFRNSLNTANFAVPDGIGLVWALNRATLPGNTSTGTWERIPGIELAEALLSLASDCTAPVMLLGGKGSAAETAARVYSTKIQGLQVVGVAGFRDRTQPTVAEQQAILSTIQRHKIQMVLIGLGAPWQEQWMISNTNTLSQAGVKIAMVVGGSFDVWAGRLARAPLSWRKANLEWLWRLLLEPRRVVRQAKLVQFVWLVLTKNPTKT